jgi:hypothetical protein
MLDPLKTLWNFGSTAMTIMFLGWYGMTAFKLGFYAQETPLLQPIVHFLLNGTENSGDRAEEPSLENTLELFWKSQSPDKN